MKLWNCSSGQARNWGGGGGRQLTCIVETSLSKCSMGVVNAGLSRGQARKVDGSRS